MKWVGTSSLDVNWNLTADWRHMTVRRPLLSLLFHVITSRSQVGVDSVDPLQVLKLEALSRQWISSALVLSDGFQCFSFRGHFLKSLLPWSLQNSSGVISLVRRSCLCVLRQVFLKVINSRCFQIRSHTLRRFCLSKTEASRFYIFKTTPWFMCIHKQPLTLFEGHWEIVNLFRKSKVGGPSARQKTSFSHWVSVSI